MKALRQRGAQKEESIHGRAHGCGTARGGPHLGGPGTAKKHKGSEQAIYAWRKHFGELSPQDIKRLRALEGENARLKKLLASASSPWTFSRRSISKSGEPACGLLGIARSTKGNELRLPIKDRPAIEVMRQLSSQYPRCGYRRIRIFLKRQGASAWLAPHASALAPGPGCSCLVAGRRGGSPAAGHVLCQPRRCELHLGLRFRLRLLCQWPAAQVPDRHRRVARECLAVDVAGFIRSKLLVAWRANAGIGPALIDPGESRQKPSPTARAWRSFPA